MNELKCDPTTSDFHLDNRIRISLSLSSPLSLFCFVSFIFSVGFIVVLCVDAYIFIPKKKLFISCHAFHLMVQR